ncbi:hypothetical protein CO038_04595 [Candidatus Pacearchaeota archaeon CG_4_9_14_0_2_um_filter_39_13]|nr:MAG: hypothetical protein CO038_04595 [Candidatus Pacearchaeota archaeon CG_4_9_14_0_2_um_filter_39_13]
MKINNKVLAFVYSDGKFLALHSNPDKEHGEGGWFVVTGGLENNESLENAVKREIKEETGLESIDVFGLNWGSLYEWHGLCEEMNFIAFVKKGKIRLNEEHNDYKWLDLEHFVNILKWSLDKKELKSVLKKAVKKELYFDKIKLDDFRKKD